MPILKSTKVHFIDEIKPARIRFSSGESLEYCLTTENTI